MPFLQERYVEVMSLASTSLRSSTVLTQDDGVPGSKFEREAENYTVDQLRRWLKCIGLKLCGKRDDLVKRVTECTKAGKHHTLDPSIDEGKKVCGESDQGELWP